MATDLEDEETAIQITWESGLDGVLNIDTPDAQACLFCYRRSPEIMSYLTAADYKGLVAVSQCVWK